MSGDGNESKREEERHTHRSFLSMCVLQQKRIERESDLEYNAWKLLIYTLFSLYLDFFFFLHFSSLRQEDDSSERNQRYDTIRQRKNERTEREWDRKELFSEQTEKESHIYTLS